MNVRDLMTASVVSVAPEDQVTDVVRLMVGQNLSGVPVVDEQNRVLGMVTENDVVAKHAQVHLPTYIGFLGTIVPFGKHRTDEEMRRILAVCARDLMTDDVAVISPDISVDEAASIMVEQEVNPLPVVEKGRLVGIISHADIMRLLLQEEEGSGSTSRP